MASENSITANWGILASMSWNSNQWAGKATEEDIGHSKYSFVKTYHSMHEDLNFGIGKFPLEKNGEYIGYTPIFQDRLPLAEHCRNLKILFLFSSDYHNDGRKSIVGFYGFPRIKHQMARTAKHSLYNTYTNGNIKALSDDIVYLKNPVIISNLSVTKLKLLPDGKKISSRGFNYLNAENVHNLLDLSTSLNSENQKLRKFVKKHFPLTNDFKNSTILESYLSFHDADSVGTVRELEDEMKDKSPEIKHIISSRIERGNIATKVKKINRYKCQICEALHQNPLSFKKKDGKYYVEAHHVEPVSTFQKGVLSVTNVITVCANHHRQLHYGNATLTSQNDKNFTFRIDDNHIKVNKVLITA
jgi:5-methylcytosine-specific restriction enzyme A